jgi:hypothetical protein|tara:strand:- start:174 stop:407 length:234 start_codon:yes stop_codon:yes gene_type:complete
VCGGENTRKARARSLSLLSLSGCCAASLTDCKTLNSRKQRETKGKKETKEAKKRPERRIFDRETVKKYTWDLSLFFV